ncbi:hypothetical protein AKJ37_02450 [candidate division MSBL1 archaeon SCGC-AAA259I09]|uniref:Uncharacterized protein n=1 Tax=candidate division MSBL1 archaeon SCGC-AAA259I09 TaxID=1698267 RepID=A0A133UU09_9EURY|nr:hypothetical protein AKJ37_02450 [candidate division MSBL1 archaeon SCGC-AAA259I09]
MQMQKAFILRVKKQPTEPRLGGDTRKTPFTVEGEASRPPLRSIQLFLGGDKKLSLTALLIRLLIFLDLSQEETAPNLPPPDAVPRGQGEFRRNPPKRERRARGNTGDTTRV